METIRAIKRSKGKRITIDLPEALRGEEIEIIILPVSNHRKLKKDKLEALLLSESSLAKDWNKDVEDQVWADL
ncbi:MAG: DUF2281 domain-containing protein [bacterium]|nr:DUF2281 domain-containing protein [bacterium]